MTAGRQRRRRRQALRWRSSSGVSGRWKEERGRDERNRDFSGLVTSSQRRSRAAIEQRAVGGGKGGVEAPQIRPGGWGVEEYMRWRYAIQVVGSWQEGGLGSLGPSGVVPTPKSSTKRATSDASLAGPPAWTDSRKRAPCPDSPASSQLPAASTSQWPGRAVKN